MNFIKNHRNLYRVICFLISLLTLATLILSMFMVYSMWFLLGMTVLYIFAFTPIMTFNTYNQFDYILYFILVLLSLLSVAAVVTDITNAIFHNNNVNIYFGITSFFTFSYLYDILFREIAKPNSFIALLPETNLLKGFYAMSARATVGISKTCNIFRLILLVFSMFSTRTDILSEYIKNLPIADVIVTDAIVTSLAIEKLIKSFYSKLGTKVDMPNQEY